jgi:hypothetical protein
VDESVVWAEPPEGESAEVAQDEKAGELDESLAMRRLKRWLSGMFGSPREPDEHSEP